MSQNRVEAVERALTILDCFSEAEKELTLASLSNKTGFYKSTIIRLTRSLERFGYIHKKDNGLYVLGPSLWRLGKLYKLDHDFGELVRAALVTLRNETQETASFYILEGQQRTCLYRENSNRAVRHHLDEGIHLPLDKGAAGKLLASFADLSSGPESLEIRTQGFAISTGERDPDIAAISVPVFSMDQSLKGALCISTPISRFHEAFQKNSLDVLLREARLLSVV